MQIESACYQLLKGNGDVVAAVGGRIFGGILPPKNEKEPFSDFPAIVYRPPSNGGGRRVVRVLEGGCALIEQRIHIFSCGRKHMIEAALIDDAVFHALDEFKGIVEDPTKSPVEALDVQAVLQSQELSHAYGYVDELKAHQFVTEYLFHYKDPLRGTPKY